jgi:hypothetical protein
MKAILEKEPEGKVFTASFSFGILGVNCAKLSIGIVGIGFAVLLPKVDDNLELPFAEPQSNHLTTAKGTPPPAQEKLAQENTRSKIGRLLFPAEATIYALPWKEVSKGKEPTLIPAPSIEKCYILPNLVNLVPEEGSTTVHFHVRPRVPLPRFDPKSPPTLAQLGYARSLASSSVGLSTPSMAVQGNLGAFATSTEDNVVGEEVDALSAVAVEETVRAISELNDVD